MSYQTGNHQLTHTFEIELECDENEEVDRRYQAWCKGLAGCWVHAGTQSKALEKIGEAIGVWLELPNRQMEGQETNTADIIARIVGE